MTGIRRRLSAALIATGAAASLLAVVPAAHALDIILDATTSPTWTAGNQYTVKWVSVGADAQPITLKLVNGNDPNVGSVTLATNVDPSTGQVTVIAPNEPAEGGYDVQIVAGDELLPAQTNTFSYAN